MKLILKKSAIKGINKMPKRQGAKMIEALEEIADGHTAGKDIGKLQGRDGYRYRQGRYRAIYKCVERTDSLLVMTVGPRGGIYK